MIFYEARLKLVNTLKDLSVTLGGKRRITLARELTKIHEEILRFTLAEAVEYYAEQTPRGEFVLVVEGAAPPQRMQKLTLEEAVVMAQALVEQGSVRQMRQKRLPDRRRLKK